MESKQSESDSEVTSSQSLDPQASSEPYRPTTIPMPDPYDPATESVYQCLRQWDIEFQDPRSLTEEQAIALEGHLLNRENHMEREHQRKLALALAPQPVRGPSEDMLARLVELRARQDMRIALLEEMGRTEDDRGSAVAATGTENTVGKLVEALSLGAGKKLNWDGNTVVGMRDEEVAALTLFTRWGKSLTALWTSGAKMSLTRWWQAIGQRAMEAMSEAEMNMVFTSKSHAERLADAKVCVLLRLPVMATEERRKMVLGVTEWKLGIQDFCSQDISTLLNVCEAIRNVDLVLEMCFGRNLGLMTEILTVVEERAVIQDLSVAYVTRAVDMMLSVLYMRMRGSKLDAEGKTVDLSVESRWRELWKEVRDACTIDREGMERDERRNGGSRKWELGLEGIMGKEKKAKGKAADGKGEEAEATPKRVKFGEEPAEIAQKKGRKCDDDERGEVDDGAGESGWRGEERQAWGGAQSERGLCVQALAQFVGFTNEACFHGGDCWFSHEFWDVSREMALRAVEDMTGKLKGSYLKGLSMAIEGHKFRGN